MVGPLFVPLRIRQLLLAAVPYPGVSVVPVLKTLWDKEPFSRHRGIKKERVIVSCDRALELRHGAGSNAPASRSGSTFRTSVRLGSSFLENPGWYFRWFHRLEAGLPGFSPLGLGLGQTFEDSQSASSLGHVCSHRAARVPVGSLSLSGCWLRCGL